MVANARWFCPVILRFGTIYGLSGRTRFDLVVNLLTAKAVVDGRITVTGGDQWRPFLHVDDAASAVLAALGAAPAQVRNRVFNVGSDEQNYTIWQIGELIRGLVPTAELVDLGTDSDRRNYRVDFGCIRSTLGFRPRWTVGGGVLQVIEAIRTGRVQDYRDVRYSNARFLQDAGGLDLLGPSGSWAWTRPAGAVPDLGSLAGGEAAAVAPPAEVIGQTAGGGPTPIRRRGSSGLPRRRLARRAAVRGDRSRPDSDQNGPPDLAGAERAGAERG